MKNLKILTFIIILYTLFLTSFVSAKTIKIEENETLTNSVDVDLLSITPEKADGINGWYVTEPYIFFNPIVGLESIYFKIDNGYWQTYSAPISQDWSDGNHIFEAKAIIEGGEEIYDSIEFKLDTTRPELFSPEIFQSPFSIKAHAIDETSGVFRFDFYYDSVFVHTDEIQPFTWNPNRDQISRGMHTVTTVVFDNAGNINQENIETWIIKNREFLLNNIFQKYPFLQIFFNVAYSRLCQLR